MNLEMPSLNVRVHTQNTSCYKFQKSLHHKSTFIVSPSITQRRVTEFNEDECNKIGDKLNRVTQLLRTNTGAKTFSEKAHFRGCQRTPRGMRSLECGKIFSYNSAITVQQGTHTIETTYDNTFRETFHF